MAQKKTKKKKSGPVSRPANKAKAAAALKAARKRTVSKARPSPAPAKKQPVRKHSAKSSGKPARPARAARPARSAARAEALKAPIKPAVAVAPPAPARLLHQTKTTAAALTLLGKGVELIFQKEFKRAKSELKSLLQLYPGETDILARARSYVRICEREEAHLRKTPASADQLYALGILEHNRSNYDAAISYFLQSLEKHPDADYIYYSLAASHARKGDAAPALENLRRAVTLNEDSRIYAKNDADFEALQKDCAFAELLGIHPPAPAESR